MKQNAHRKDSGAMGVAPWIIIVAGFASVTIIAASWIGNSTTGVAADTVECISASSSGDQRYALNVCEEESDKSQIAATGNSSSSGWTQRFGTTANSPKPGELTDEQKSDAKAKALSNLNRGLLRFGGLKSSVSNDAGSSIAALRSATSRAEAIAALNSIRTTISTSKKDGEISGSNLTILYARDQLKASGNVGWVSADYAQRLAETGNRYANSALGTADFALQNSSMSLSELKSYADSIANDLRLSESHAKAAMPYIKRAYDMTQTLP